MWIFIDNTHAMLYFTGMSVKLKLFEFTTAGIKSNAGYRCHVVYHNGKRVAKLTI